MKSLLLTLLKYLSLPLAILYGVVVWLRNKFYDWKIFSSIGFNVPVICVGNLTVGGTGKTPHIEYLIELLGHRYAIATLSRGYRRRTQGFRLATENSDARELGDEPFQFKTKYPFIEVAVAEERMTAIPLLLQQKPWIQTILLDDAFQHRTVKAGLNILLTDYGRLYTRDYIMPFGLLREGRSAASRAQIIVVSKCPETMQLDEKTAILREIAPLPNQQVFFTSIRYDQIYPLLDSDFVPDSSYTVLLVTGIANPQPLIQRYKKEFQRVFSLPYPDHHYYTYDDLEEMRETFEKIEDSKKIIITTEKDAGRLRLLRDKLRPMQLPIFAQKIGTDFLFGEEQGFVESIESFLETHYPPQPEITVETHATDSLNTGIQE